MSLDGVHGFLDVESAALRAPQVGVANTNPQHILSVGSNLYVSGDSPDVLTVDGNVVCEGVKVGLIEIIPSYDLEAVANVGNSTSNTIQFTNPGTGIVATGNVTVGKTLTVEGFRITAQAASVDTLDSITTDDPAEGKINSGVTDNPIHITNATDSEDPYTGALQIGTSTGAFGGLGVAGNVHVGRGVYAQDLDVDGDAIIRGDLSVLGTTTTIDTDHLRVQDPIIELGKDNAGTGDLGLVMTRPSGSSNVAVIFDESADTLEIGYTQSNASDTDIAMRTAAIEPLSVNVNGNVSVGKELTVTGNVAVGTNKLFIDTVGGNVGIGTTTPDETLSIYKEDTTAAGQTVISSITGVFSGSDATGGNINNRGLFIYLDSSATGGTATNAEEHRLWGIDVDIDVTGDSDDIKGGRFLVRSEMAANGTDQNTNIYGIDAQGQHNGSAPSTNIIGVRGRSLKGADSTGLTDRMTCFDAEYEISAGTCTDAYGVRVRFDRNGGAVSNSYIFYGDHIGSATTITNNYGLYVINADKHYLEGNVGIGTTNPDNVLHIRNAIPAVLLDDSDDDTKVRITGGAGGDLYVDSNWGGSGNTGDIIFREASSEKMRITGSGNVGIGTTNPRVDLEIENVNGSPELRFTDPFSGGGASWDARSNVLGEISWYSRDNQFTDSYGKVASITSKHFDDGWPDGALCFTTSTNGVLNEDAMVIHQNGNVGIGTTSPSHALTVAAASGDAEVHIQAQGNDGGDAILYFNGSSTNQRKCAIISSNVAPNSYCKQDLHFCMETTNDLSDVDITDSKMVITNAGNVGIGATNPGSLLHIYSPLTNSATLKIEGRRTNQNPVYETVWVQKGASGDRAIQQQSYPHSSSADIIHNWLSWNSAGTGWDYPMQLTAGGNLTITGSYSPSDDRLKTNEVFLENATETLLKLKPQKYDKHKFSFIEISSEEYSNNVVDGNVFIESANTWFDVNDFRYSPSEDIWYKRTLSDETHEEAGLIAQEIWYDAPELRYIISVPSDAQIPETKPETSDDPTIDPDYENWGRTNATVNYTHIIPYLIKSNQELHTQLTSVLTRLDALESA
jgi:hypothetical protein